MQTTVISFKRVTPIRRNWWRFLQSALQAMRERRQLERLEAHQLRDIGITSYEARCECKRPLFDLPARFEAHIRG